MASQFVIPVGTVPTEGGIPADAVALRNPSFPREASFPLNPSFPRKRESRDLCDRKAGIGRLALGSRSPIGVGDKLRGNDGGAVDSRFRGNDRWVGMTDGWEWWTGGDDGWAGMTDGRE